VAKSELTAAFDKINAVVTDVPKEVLTEVGQRVITIVTLRTRKGLDADGDVFRPYVPKYAKWRAKRKLRTSPPDLTVTGHMLGSMTPAITGQSEVTVEFNGAKEIAKALGNMSKRDFFDVRQDAELEAIMEDLADGLIAEIVK